MKNIKRSIAIVLVFAVISSLLLCIPATAWNASPASYVDMSLSLVGMMNMKIFQDSPYIANVSTDPTNKEYSKTFTLSEFDLTIGSLSDALKPAVSVTGTDIVFSDLRPKTCPGSERFFGFCLSEKA